MNKDPVILHCDMNNFYASVELLERPDLSKYPVAVCGNPENRRGIVLAKNQIAKECGVLTAETIWQAKKKCPDLKLLPHNMNKYRQYSKKINAIYQRYTDLVETFSIDESWLDVTTSQVLFGDGKTIADNIRKTVKEELGLTLSAGVSFNKIFAKMGSDYKKPDATTVISRENYRDILWPMSVKSMFFVGKVSGEKLMDHGIYTIGELASANKNFLIGLLGKQGEMLHKYANGEDREPVTHQENPDQVKSVGHGLTFSRNLSGIEDIKTAVVALSDKVTARLRSLNMKAEGVKVEIKDPSFHVISRQKQLATPSQTSTEFVQAAMELITSSWPPNKPIRLLSVTGINLCPEDEAEQISIFETENKDREKLTHMDQAMDTIRKKYGSSSISFGSVLKNDLGIDPGNFRDDES